LRPVVLRCRVKKCNAVLVPVEIEPARNGLLCELCGAVYCYLRRPGQRHHTICRYLPRPTVDDLD
jgi:hypothetical protein